MRPFETRRAQPAREWGLVPLVCLRNWRKTRPPAALKRSRQIERVIPRAGCLLDVSVRSESYYSLRFPLLERCFGRNFHSIHSGRGFQFHFVAGVSFPCDTQVNRGDTRPARRESIARPRIECSDDDALLLNRFRVIERRFFERRMLAAFDTHHLGLAGRDQKFELIGRERFSMRIEEDIDSLKPDARVGGCGLPQQRTHQRGEQRDNLADPSHDRLRFLSAGSARVLARSVSTDGSGFASTLTPPASKERIPGAATGDSSPRSSRSPLSKPQQMRNASNTGPFSDPTFSSPASLLRAGILTLRFGPGPA